ncbi:PAS domain S-box protein, partial [Singulisphaera rosea]
TADFGRRQRWEIGQLESAYEAINDVLDEATAESVRQFQEDSRSETQKALAEVKKRQQSIEDAWITAKLEKSKLRTILDSLPVAVWVVDADGAVISINDEALRIQGVASREEFGEVNVFDLGPDYLYYQLDGTKYPREQLPILRSLRGEIVTQQELIRIIQGEPRTLAINSAPLLDSAGAVIGAVAVVQDITQRTQVEEQLRQERNFSRAITDTLGEGLCTIDTSGKTTFVNPAATEMLGWTEAELLGKDLHETIHFERLDGTPYPHAECPSLEVLRTGETVHGDEVFIRRDGSKFIVAFTASPIVSGGRIVGIAEAFRDITGRKLLEAKLAASEAQFRSIAEKSPVMIWRTDAEGNCNYVNETWVEFRGRTLDHHLNDGPDDWIHPDDRPQCLSLFREAFARQEPFELTYRLLRNDGQYRWVSDRGTPYRDADGAFLGYLGSCLDITERIDLETSLEQQRELAEEASQHKTRLVSALSHDARTPLNAVVLAAQLLEIHLDDGADPEVKACLRTIRH